MYNNINEDEMKKSTRSRVIEWAIIFTAISSMIAIINVGVSRYQHLHSDKNTDSTGSITVTYDKSKPLTGGGVMEPTAGKLYCGWQQVEGNKKCKYTLKYKKTTEKDFTIIWKDKTFSENKVRTNDIYICTTDGSTDYNIVCEKTIGGKKSSVLIDWMLK